jgi:hypothetical protein
MTTTSVSGQTLPYGPFLKLILGGAVCVGSIIRRSDMECANQKIPSPLPFTFAIPLLPLLQRNDLRSIRNLQAAIAADSDGKDRTTLCR